MKVLLKIPSLVALLLLVWTNPIGASNVDRESALCERLLGVQPVATLIANLAGRLDRFGSFTVRIRAKTYSNADFGRLKDRVGFRSAAKFDVSNIEADGKKVNVDVG